MEGVVVTHRTSSSGSCGQERCACLPLWVGGDRDIMVLVVDNDELIVMSIAGAAVVSALIFG